MDQEILSPKQKEILPFLTNFKEKFLLVGGTAIALYLGHRKSVDFDLATQKEINPLNTEII